MSSEPETWPLRARVYTRTSTEPHEKVLEIEGNINDTYMVCRHTQSINVTDEEVPGLDELYKKLENLENELKCNRKNFYLLQKDNQELTEQRDRALLENRLLKKD